MRSSDSFHCVCTYLYVTNEVKAINNAHALHMHYAQVPLLPRMHMYASVYAKDENKPATGMHDSAIIKHAVSRQALRMGPTHTHSLPTKSESIAISFSWRHGA